MKQVKVLFEIIFQATFKNFWMKQLKVLFEIKFQATNSSKLGFEICLCYHLLHESTWPLLIPSMAHFRLLLPTIAHPRSSPGEIS